MHNNIQYPHNYIMSLHLISFFLFPATKAIFNNYNHYTHPQYRPSIVESNYVDPPDIPESQMHNGNELIQQVSKFNNHNTNFDQDIIDADGDNEDDDDDDEDAVFTESRENRESDINNLLIVLTGESVTNSNNNIEYATPTHPVTTIATTITYVQQPTMPTIRTTLATPPTTTGTTILPKSKWLYEI